MTTGSRQTDAAEGRARRGPTALALVVFFLVGTFASAAGIHGCPRHHHHTPSPEAVTSGVPAGAGGERAAPRDGRDGEGPAGSPCTCLGDCQSGAPTALPEPPARAVPDAEPLARAGSPDDAEIRPGPRPEYFLPYPLGPPVA